MQTEKCQNAQINNLAKKSIKIKIENFTVKSLRKIRFYLFTRALNNLLGTKKYYSGKKKTELALAPGNKKPAEKIIFKEGERVRIKSREKILETLNEHNKTGGCFFMQEMFDYCGTEQKILRKIDNFFDEASGTMRKSGTSYLLEGMHCSGKLTGYTTKCDRYCYSFWKDAWLEKID